MHEELIQLLATATQLACARIPDSRLADLGASLNQACAVPAEFGSERKAAAHAELFNALAGAAALEMEKHLRTLHFMGRLAAPPGQRASA